ncbi:MAG: hypothetical protein K0S18_736 [Anaerocolumna sp.]|jgi:hypothetical protein|nr:hypothetical protein [Anaerocolumna sp.]
MEIGISTQFTNVYNYAIFPYLSKKFVTEVTAGKRQSFASQILSCMSSYAQHTKQETYENSIHLFIYF